MLDYVLQVAPESPAKGAAEGTDMPTLQGLGRCKGNDAGTWTG